MMRSFVSASLAAAAVPSRSRAAVLVRRRGTAAAAALATRRSDDHSSQHNGTSSSSQRGGQWERRRVGRGATAAAAAASTAAVAASSALLFSSSSATGTDASSSAATAMPLRDSSSSSSSPSPSSSSSSSPPEFLLRRRTSTPAVPHPGASPKPSSAGTRDICDDAPTLEMLPVYRSSDVAKNDGRDGRPIWMSYGGVVYDVTHFVPNHPGGTEKILTAAGAVRHRLFLFSAVHIIYIASCSGLIGCVRHGARIRGIFVRGWFCRVESCCVSHCVRSLDIDFRHTLVASGHHLLDGQSPVLNPSSSLCEWAASVVYICSFRLVLLCYVTCVFSQLSFGA
mmetsp:Transcript_19051/g.35436  ORF Transcript_19051/g.35436 Transcript_19051/m.35436 type:complete len:339 (+) Transcript_19051:376-1392(+)